ncbi:oxygen-dependent protoporphyrinogen oxidase [Litorimonas taeanensis]|uniref:Oxygen-dependent protoporphyrinogen oxidase n=1 Tax=Litorimonas taeanensis TaxID=568099 RepID=A0A420WDX0_9PROT|nr:FAD-dependent oxidoreductase [Litorimonas taeanensis]RKQ69193.1 oxygen-dependent protoporphyrinogen oxidase [Litorimonas taeanensis]
MTGKNHRVAVIGGGVSGIAAAHYLLQAGYQVDLYEASNRLGGRVSIGNLSGEEVCFGGKNIGYDYIEFRKFLACYGKPEYEYFGINSARLIRGVLTPYNSQNKLKSLWTLWRSGKLSDLIRLRKFVTLVRNNRNFGDTNCGEISRHKGRSVAEMFSPSFTQSIIRALTIRMNGAEPKEISVENFGTHLQMLQDEYEQLKSPISEFFRRFQCHPSLRVFLNTPIQNIEDARAVGRVPEDEPIRHKGSKAARFVLRLEGETKAYQSVIVCLPAHGAKRCLQRSYPQLAIPLSAVRYFPVAVIIADYAQDVFKPEIRACTFGPENSLSNIGAYGLTALNRVRYTFSGEEAAELLLEALDDDYLLTAAEAQARPYFNLDNNPCTSYKVRYWEKGLCAYTKNEAAFQTELGLALNEIAGLELAGDYQKGASIENCFRAAKHAVARLCQSENDSDAFNLSPPKSIYLKGAAHV